MNSSRDVKEKAQKEDNIMEIWLQQQRQAFVILYQS
jgi:hypothetical protein